MGIGVGEARAVLASTVAATEAVSRVGMEGSMVGVAGLGGLRYEVGRVGWEGFVGDYGDETGASCSRGLGRGKERGRELSIELHTGEALYIYSISLNTVANVG